MVKMTLLNHGGLGDRVHGQQPDARDMARAGAHHGWHGEDVHNGMQELDPVLQRWWTEKKAWSWARWCCCCASEGGGEAVAPADERELQDYDFWARSGETGQGCRSDQKEQAWLRMELTCAAMWCLTATAPGMMIIGTVAHQQGTTRCPRVGVTNVQRWATSRAGVHSRVVAWAERHHRG